MPKSNEKSPADLTFMKEYLDCEKKQRHPEGTHTERARTRTQKRPEPGQVSNPGLSCKNSANQTLSPLLLSF